MAFPVCEGCASSGTLCPECQEKVREGKISELDVLLSTILKSHGAGGYDSLIELDKKIVIIAPEDELPKIIGHRGKTASELSAKLGRRMVVVSRSMDKKTLAESLARPNRLVAINKVFKEGGAEVLKLIFDKPLDEGTVRVLKDLAGEVEIDYEED